MNRGSDHDDQRARVRAAGFNEAPIHESGKCGRPPGKIAAPLRFNEAPIHESGKWAPSTSECLSCR